MNFYQMNEKKKKISILLVWNKFSQPKLFL